MDDVRRARVDDLDRLAAVAATGMIDTPADEAFDRLAQLAATVLDTPFAFVTLVDDRRSFWKSCIGIDATNPADRQNAVEESFCQYVIASGEPLIVDDAAHHPVTMHNPSIESMGVAAWAGFPLLSASGQVLGTFCVVDTVVRNWSERDVEILRALSAATSGELALRESVATAQAAVAARERANARLALLAEVGATLSETLDIEEAVGALARVVVPILGDWCVVSLIESDGSLRDVATWHADPALMDAANRFMGTRFQGIHGQGSTYAAKRSTEMIVAESGAVEAGLSVLLSETARQALLELAPHSFGIFPLVAREHVNGVLAITRRADRPPMSPEELEVAGAVAVRAGLALDNAYLYAEQKWVTAELHKATARVREAAAHDRSVSRALQDAMLTHLPQPAGLALTARYRTASGTDQVGGDWYDAIASADGTTSLVVGDVAGHDIAAAGIMGQLRNMVRAFAWDRREPPADSVSRLDRAMRDLEIEILTTLAIVRVEPVDDSSGSALLRWASAGHPPPIVISPDGVPSYLVGQVDQPLSVDADSPRVDHELRVPAGTTILLYTDGLIETRDSDIDARQERLLQAIVAHRSIPADAMIDAVLGEMVGEHPVDDVALLIARIHAD